MKKILSIVLTLIILCASLPLCAVNVAAEVTPTFAIGSAAGRVGETVTVDVTAKNNPGIVSMKLLVAYDSDALELIDRTTGDLFRPMSFSDTFDANPYIFSWIDVLNPDNTSNGTVVSLTFKIKDSAAVGEYPITVSYDQADVYNSYFDNVYFETENGSITVEPCPHNSITTSTENEVAATCTDNGYYDKVIYCNECEKELSRDTVTVMATGHSIDKNGLCSGCGKTFEVPMFLVSQTRGKTGTEITVTVSTLNNPGIVSMLLWLGYDSDALELTAISGAEFDAVQFGPLTANPVAINWVDGLNDNNTTNGDVAILTFKVKDDAVKGVYSITLTYDPEDVFDYNLKNVYFNVQNGAVEVYYCDHTPSAAVQENVVSATCIYDSSYDDVVYCSNCGEELSRNHVTVEAPGHRFTVITEVSADCYNTGVAAHKLCNVCNKKFPTGAGIMVPDSQALSYDQLILPYAHQADTNGKCQLCGNYVFTEPTFAVSYTSGNVGGTVNVTVSTVNNPGIVSLKLLVSYNTDVFEMMNYERGVFSGLSTNAIGQTPFILNWVDTINPDNKTDGDIATLTFKIKENAAIGEYPITITYDADDVYNSDWNNVGFNIHNGVISVVECDHSDRNIVIENNILPTCTKSGSYDEVEYCNCCGYEFSRVTQFVSNTGHTAGEPVENERYEATCTEDGYYIVVELCKTCGEEISRQTKTLPAFGHSDTYDSTENIINATCTVDGSYDCVSRCIECDAELARETIVLKSQGHVYDNNRDAECNNCDYVRVLYAPGDVNGDGCVNNKDLGLLMQYLNGWEVQIVAYAAEVNADGKLNNRDYALLKQYLNEIDVELR